jgi:CheY-like chemotaxis protein
MDRTPLSCSAKQLLTSSRVLVVDDNQDAASSLALLLTMLGHEVQTANNGLEALDAIQSFDPGVVFLDLGMPGMSGYEVADRARAMSGGRESVLVALTGWGQESDRQRTRQAGFDYHLVKPVERSTIEALLSEIQSQSTAKTLVTRA